MEQLIQQVASGLANGAIYACLALALVMIFVSTDHINFAQGELAMFSAYLVWQALAWGLNFWVALPAVALLSFLIGVGIERVILRPLHHAPVLSVVVVFIGLLAIFHSLAGAIWGHTIKAIPSPFPHITFVGSGYIGPHQIGMIVVTVALLLALFAFFRFTPSGLPCVRRRRTQPRPGSPAFVSTGCWRSVGDWRPPSARLPARWSPRRSTSSPI